MKLKRLILSGMSSAFPGVVDLDFSDVPAGLVAVTGPNWSGKTTLIESVPGAVHRLFPSRKKEGVDPVRYAVTRESYIDLTTDCDAAGIFHHRLNFDGETRKSDAVLEEWDGERFQPINKGGQVTTYDEAIAARFPSKLVFLNSAFAAQGRGDAFVRATPSERKDLYIESLALEHLLAMSRRAGLAMERCATVRQRLDATVAVLVRDTAPEHNAAIDRLESEQICQREADLVKLRAQGDLITALESRIAAASTTDTTAALEAARLRVRQIEPELLARQKDLDTLRTTREAAVDESVKETTAQMTSRDTALAEITSRRTSYQQVLDARARIESAVASVKSIDTDLETLRKGQGVDQAQYDLVVKELAAAEKAVSSFAVPQRDLERAKTDSRLLQHVPCGGKGAYAMCELLKSALDAAALVPTLKAKLEGVTDAIAQRDSLTVERDRLAGRLQTVRATIADREKTRGDHALDAARAAGLADASARIEELERRAAELVATTTTAVDAVRTRLEMRLAELDAQAPIIQAAIDRLTIDYDFAHADLASAEVGDQAATGLRSSLTAAQLEFDAIANRVLKADSAIESLDVRRAELTVKRDQLAAVRLQLRQVVDHYLEWEFFKKALGKGGLPDLEIDAAGPTIGSLTNALLLASYGPRFSMELVTQTAKADGGMKDEFTVRVLDSDAPIGDGWRDIGELSGAQKVIVQEALMCAICIFVNERSPMPMRTLFRDETGAPLSQENAVRYVQMLQKVREIGHFHHVFFVSHNPIASGLADTQIVVGDGTARIVARPFEEAA